MQINLIPAGQIGSSYGTDVLIAAIERFSQQLLDVIIFQDPTNKAKFDAVIVLFREPGTIGQITGFILEHGMNIGFSGTGGRYGKAFMQCITTHNIQIRTYPTTEAYNLFAEWSQLGDKFHIFNLLTHKRLSYWERFIIEMVMTDLHDEVIDPNEKIFGGWQHSWQAGDV